MLCKGMLELMGWNKFSICSSLSRFVRSLKEVINGLFLVAPFVVLKTKIFERSNFPIKKTLKESLNEIDDNFFKKLFFLIKLKK